MCVICYVPRGVRLPSKDTIRAMWDKNPHGGGIVYKDSDNNVYYKKGYFDFDMFYNDLVEISDVAVEMAMHTRIATSGGINAEMCHPFRLSNSKDDLRCTSGEKCTEPIIMHNGMINVDIMKGLNDTCSYIIKKLYPRYKKHNAFMFDNQIVKKIENEIGYSKLLIMSQYPTKLIGDWKTDDDGCYYSNLYFKPRKQVDYGYNVYGYKYRNKYDLFDSYSDIYSDLD